MTAAKQRPQVAQAGPVAPPLGAPIPNLVGAIHLWIDSLPNLVRLSKCPRCLSLVLMADLDAHTLWHARMGA